MPIHNDKSHDPLFQSHRHCVLRFQTCLFAGAAMLSAPAWSDPPQLKQFEICTQKVIAAEKAKEIPDAKQVLATCSREYDALIAVLPPGSREPLTHHLGHEVKNLLEPEKK